MPSARIEFKWMFIRDVKTSMTLTFFLKTFAFFIIDMPPKMVEIVFLPTLKTAVLGIS